jgi:dephospho-CoA kinase
MEAGIKKCPVGEVLVDVPLLFEAGWEAYFDHRVVVFACDAVCCSRIVKRDGISPEEAWRTVHSQVPLNEKVIRADHVINNTGCRVASRLEIIHLARLITPGTRKA